MKMNFYHDERLTIKREKKEENFLKLISSSIIQFWLDLFYDFELCSIEGVRFNSLLSSKMILFMSSMQAYEF